MPRWMVAILIFTGISCISLVLNEYLQQSFGDTQASSVKPRKEETPYEINITPNVVYFGSPLITSICSSNNSYQIGFNQDENTPNLNIHGCTYAFMGIDLNEQGPRKVEITYTDQKSHQKVRRIIPIHERSYDQEKLRFYKPRLIWNKKFKFPFNNLPLEQMSELKSNFPLQKSVTIITNANKSQLTSFQYPVHADISSHFGNIRRKNKKTYKRHYGVDYIVPKYTRIFPMTGGTVTVSKRDPYMGRVVVIDHGLGISSIYCHLAVRLVEKYEYIDKDTVLGLSGSSGRSTGPHLHLGLSIGGVRTDPDQFLKMVGAVYRPGQRKFAKK